MFKRPRSHKESALASQSKNKRLKEDCSSVQVRQSTPRENYINVTRSISGSLLDRGLESSANVLQHQGTAVVDSMDQESTRYNHLKLQGAGSRHEPRMLHSCVNQCDSETSSIASEVTEGLKSKEKEHYNKLKVDVKQAQTNKKLLRGVKILQSQDNPQTGVNGISKSSPQAGKLPHCSATKVHHLQPPVKYRKEGHTNQLHSVSGTFHSLQNPTKPSSLLPKSKSTGDIKSFSHNADVACLSYNIRRHQLTHSRSTHNISATESHSMSVSDSYSIGRAAGVSHSPSPSADKAHHQQTSASTQLPFINKMITFTCAHEGREINSTAYDFSVKILKGTVRKRKCIAFNVGVCLHGPFSFPRGYKLVSPILMVTSPTTNKLKKPIEVLLSHCIDVASQTGKNEDVTFFRARKVRENGLSQQNYQFEPTDADTNHFEMHNNQGKLSSTELGFFCIMTKEVADTRRKTNYCLVPVVPKHIESSSWKVHYCVTLHLQAFVNVSCDIPRFLTLSAHSACFDTLRVHLYGKFQHQLH